MRRVALLLLFACAAFPRKADAGCKEHDGFGQAAAAAEAVFVVEALGEEAEARPGIGDVFPVRFVRALRGDAPDTPRLLIESGYNDGSTLLRRAQAGTRWLAALHLDGERWAASWCARSIVRIDHEMADVCPGGRWIGAGADRLFVLDERMSIEAIERALLRGEPLGCQPPEEEVRGGPGRPVHFELVDAQGAPIPGAACALASGAHFRTDASGRFVAEQVPPEAVMRCRVFDVAGRIPAAATRVRLVGRVRSPGPIAP